jgi:EpsI family protein
MAATLAVWTLPEREEIVPDRAYFADFPLQLSDWSADVGQLDQIYVDALKFEDYFLADYSNPKGDLVNVYVAYYESQRKGASVHSPRSCIPGGGWRITDLSQRSIDGVEASGKPLRVNRVQIELEDTKQLVYYWFQQRGRILTNEYLVKWYLFWDALTRSRTDGALVRLTAAVRPGQDVAAVDGQLAAMVRLIVPPLDRYIPE